ncbi:MAG: phosphatase PAP2 family protein [Nanoarchaeota archaeon]
MKFSYLLILILLLGGYLLVNEMNQGKAVFDVETPFDSEIPFLSFMVIFYILLFPLILIPFFIVKNHKKIILQYVIITMISCWIFLALPSSIIRPDLNENNFFEKTLSYLYSVDKPYNLFPSLHASLLALAFIFIFNQNKKLSYNLLPLFILSFVSTLFVKQHYILDLVAGLLLAFITIKVAEKFEKVM